MTPSEFCYWLQGHLEIGGAAIKQLDEAQTQMIREHLGYVFEHMGGRKPVMSPLIKKALEEAIERLHKEEGDDGLTPRIPRIRFDTPHRLIC